MGEREIRMWVSALLNRAKDVMVAGTIGRVFVASSFFQMRWFRRLPIVIISTAKMAVLFPNGDTPLKKVLCLLAFPGRS